MSDKGNTIILILEDKDTLWDVWALHNETVLHVETQGEHLEEVWQFAPGIPGEARDFIVRSTAELEAEGGRLLIEPTQFDLSEAAIAEIREDVTRGWVRSPRLCEELMTKAHGLLGARITWTPDTGTSLAEWATVITTTSTNPSYVPVKPEYQKPFWSSVSTPTTWSTGTWISTTTSSEDKK